jgi:hypothetical protein
MLIINIMVETLKSKATNYFILGAIAESLGMFSEGATNYFKALFAIDDAAIFEAIKNKPKDHNERFTMLKSHLPILYIITDKLFSTYRRTYTKDLEKEEVKLVKKRVIEAFENAKIRIPTDEEIKKKFAELSKKGKIIG